MYKNSVDIRQKPPTINTLNVWDKLTTGTENRIIIRVRNIKILDPDIGGEGKPSIKVFVDKAVRCEIEGYRAGEPQLIKEDESYTVELELNGNLPKDAVKVKGYVIFNIYAQATNPINGKTSTIEPKQIAIKLNFEPERETISERGEKQKKLKKYEKVIGNCVKKASPEVIKIVKDGVAVHKSYDDIIIDFLIKGLTPPDDLECIYDNLRSSSNGLEE